MKTRLSDEQHKAIKAASQWYVKLNSEDVSPHQTARWYKWYHENDTNLWAWQEIITLHEQLSSLPVDIAKETLTIDSHLTRRHVIKGVAISTGLIAACFFSLSDPGKGIFANYRTGKGTIRKHRLSDGTVMTLNTDSAVDVTFNENERVVKLLYGEIAITTAKDVQNRPFRVMTPEGIMTALGTSFGVRLLKKQVLLVVNQHAVQVVPANSSTEMKIVHSGYHVYFNASECGIPAPNDGKELSWMEGILRFIDQPLEEVINTLSRYRYGIVRCSPSVAGLRLTAKFSTDNTDFAFDAIAQTLPVKIEYFTRYWVNISRK